MSAPLGEMHRKYGFGICPTALHGLHSIQERHEFEVYDKVATQFHIHCIF
jgi:hypothetical protein